MVSLALVSLLMTSITAIVQAGCRYYLSSTLTTDLQQACLITAAELCSQLSEGDETSVNTWEDPAGVSFTTPRGIVFGSPRDPKGNVVFSGTSMIWQKWVAYYVELDPDAGFRLMRKEEFFTDPSATNAPTMPATDPPVVPADHDIAYFQARPNLTQRTVAKYIYDLDVTRTYPLFVTIGAQDPGNQYRVVVQTKVKMRN